MKSEVLERGRAAYAEEELAPCSRWWLRRENRQLSGLILPLAIENPPSMHQRPAAAAINGEPLVSASVLLSPSLRVWL